MTKSTIASHPFAAPALAGVMCVALLSLQVANNASAPPIDAEPAIGAATASDWTELPDIKNARFEASAVQYQGDVYAFNGFGQSIKVEPTVEKLDADTLTWSVISETSIELGNAVTHNGIVLNGNEVWIIGGRVGNHPGPVTANVWKFNLDSRVWTAGPTLPVPGAAGGAALVNNRIHWFGGLDTVSQCDVDNHFVYDLNNALAGWQDISATAPMPVPRNHFATVVLDGLIYAMGGQFTHDGCGPGTPDTELSHVFDPATNTWTQIASLPAVQSHTEPSTFVHKGAIYMIGGATMGTTVFRYDPAIDQWDSVAQLPQPLLAPVARVLNGDLIVSSGGAPAIVPSFKTYKTDITPLLLSAAQNSQDSNQPSDNSNNSDSGSTDTQDQTDQGDSSTAEPDAEDENNPTVQPDPGNCDYSNAAASGGWGWDPIALVSCPPLPVEETEDEPAPVQAEVEPEDEAPQETVDAATDNESPQPPVVVDTGNDAPQAPADTDVENVDSGPNSDNQSIVVVVNPQPQTNAPQMTDETSSAASSGGGAVDKLLLLGLLIVSGLRATQRSGSDKRGNPRMRKDLSDCKAEVQP